MELRQYQKDAIDSIYQYYETRTGNAVVVAPTGSGKSILIAKFTESVLKKWGHQRILILAHRKELLEQNAEKILAIWPEAPLGIYSAGLNKRQIGKAITMAGIQSVAKKPHLLGWVSLVLIDEAHLLSRDAMGQYLGLINKLKEINPQLKIIGFTATPYRLDSGMLTQGKDRIFTDICYEINVADLIKAGYLTPMFSKVSNIEADLSEVHLRGREYIANELEEAMTGEALVASTVEQIVEYGKDRKSWIIFCCGIKHVEMVVNALKASDIVANGVIGDTPSLERRRILREFKEGKIRAIVNCDVLTTGFDAPNIDMLVMLRPTKSTGLYVQMVGRGSRLSPQTAKENCLVLDFSGNILEHGPITDIVIKTSNKNGEKKEELEKSEVKVCKECRTPNALDATICIECGAPFSVPREIKHDSRPHDIDILGDRIAEWVDVDSVAYSRHMKEGSPDSLLARYYNDEGRMQYREWVCINHTGFAREKAIQWILKRTSVKDFAQVTLENLLTYSSHLKVPKRIKVKKAGKYWEVLDYDFRSSGETSADSELGDGPRRNKEIPGHHAMW